MRVASGSDHCAQMGRIVACACAVLCLFCTVPLEAQFDTGQISGFIRDAGGLVVPGVSVTATDEGNLKQREAVTNTDGYYVFPNLPVGTYAIAAELTGFTRSVTKGVRLAAQTQISVNMKLEVGALSETVVVTADVEAMSENTVLGRRVSSDQIEALPLSGQNPIDTSRLQAGVVGDRMSSFAGAAISSGITSISGGRANDVVVTVDGAIANRTRSTSNTVLGAQQNDTVEEVQVLTSNYAAEFGRASSGVVRMVTKGGTREFHGTLSELHQDGNLNSNTWARNASGSPSLSTAPYFKYNQYGGTLGGPIFIPGTFNSDRSKLFFFWGEEQTRQNQITTTMLTVPSLAMRQGDFSELLNPANPYFGRARIITDPTTGQPFPGNIIPAGRLSAQGMALLGVFPAPTPGFQQGTANWVGTFPTFQNSQKDSLRIDYQVTHGNSLAFRVTRVPLTFNSKGGSTRFDTINSRPNRTAVVTFSSTFSTTFLNELTLSGSSDGAGVITNDPACGARCQRSTYGVSYPFIFPASGKLDPEKLPSISITGLSSLDMGPYPGFWSGYTYQFTDNMTKVMDRHTLKWGVTIERSGQADQIQGTTASAPATNNQNGFFTFLDTGSPQTTGLAMANALMGNFNNYSELSAKPNTPFVSTLFDGFVQDSWKPTQQLTMEIGMRYSLWPAWHSKLNTLSEFNAAFYNPAQAVAIDPKGGFITSGVPSYNGIVIAGSAPSSAALSQFPFLSNFTGLYHGLPAGLAATEWKNFQPRFGMAYTLNDKTIVRAGIGKFFNLTGINRNTAQGGQAPFMQQVTVINGSADAPGGATPQVFPFTISAQDSRLPWPNAWVGNVTVQRQLPAKFSVEVSFVGRRGSNNQRIVNINQLQAGTLQANPGVNVNALRPYVGMGIIGLAANTGTSRYNGLQISANRRMTAGFQLGVSYTYSRNWDNGSSETDILPNAYNTSSYWGVSDLDFPHVLLVNYTYQPPSPRFAPWLLGGWSFSGVDQAQSGAPFSVRQNVDFAGVGAGSGTQFWNQVADPTQVTRTPFTTSAVWFNSAAFATPAQGTFGKQLRNGLRNPGFWEANLSVRKRLMAVNHHTLDFRCDAFDLLNHAGLDVAINNPASANFGQVTNKTGNRTVQLVLQYRF